MKNQFDDLFWGIILNLFVNIYKYKVSNYITCTVKVINRKIHFVIYSDSEFMN